MCDEKLMFVGIIATSGSIDKFEVFDGFLTVENGKITRKGTIEEFENLEKSGLSSKYKITQLNADQFLMPGFVDCHTHAPQFPNIGLGLDRPLLEWLEKYTFPLEKKYSDKNFAAKVYHHVVRRLLDNGTTTACYFGSLNLEGTMELVKSAIRHGQRALVGKVSMNIANDAGYYNDTDKELAEVITFIENVLAYKNELIQPVVTPRFAISCDETLMTGLAEISRKYGCGIQSHISENLNEIEYVLKTNPDCKSYAEVYDKSHILNKKCIMAHGVYLTTDEMTLLASKGVSVAHCPASNTRLKSGLCPVRRLVQNGLTVGLGTDISAGDSPSILDAIRRCMDVSTHLQLCGDKEPSIEWTEAFYLATLGGAKALNLDDKIGSFEVGKDFDALLIDVFTDKGPIDRYQNSVEDSDHASHLLQRFIYLGDDRNISNVYIKGVEVKNI